MTQQCLYPKQLMKLPLSFVFNSLGIFGTSYYILHTCTNSVAAIGCPIFRHIHIESVKDESGCTSIGTSSVKTHLITSCDKKRKCSTGTSTSVFHDRFVSVSYECKESTDSPVTDSTQSTSSDDELDMTTISTAYVTNESDMLPMFRFDNDSRIEINHHTLNNTVYLCSYRWDDSDAGVLCKTLNKTWTGHAIDEDKLFDLDTAPYSLHCNGLETSLFECNYTIDQQGCNISKVAGAICCQGTGRPGECLTNTSTMISSLTQDSSTIGVAVGIPLALIALVGFIIAIVFIRRRYICTNSDKKISNSMRKNADNNYIGQQGISLPQYPSNNRIVCDQATNSTPTQGIGGIQEYSHPSKDATSLYSLSEEGVYDKANENRHVVNDTAVYSRAIDTMYDSTDQHNIEESKDGTYDHVFGQKTEDQYDITTRT
ncbi:Hypothetical predicted protein [Mytilus galloprovincialis]|uniref:SRCR domain-containing protein n=1 Tax=Mytilus galloprovincialis TaxID=29158 RepID=A0A8B6CUF4_MYTGA|nr:Hypothetical predicted protein [Mytilus galloprovincialis]